MKTRIITAIVGIIVLIGVMFTFNVTERKEHNNER